LDSRQFYDFLMNCRQRDRATPLEKSHFAEEYNEETNGSRKEP